MGVRAKRLHARTLSGFLTTALLLALLVSSPARAAPGWQNAETLDPGISTGTDTATVYYPVFEQHHVFNQGIESGLSVLRHGWFQPGYASWVFETLDRGVSTGTDTATVVFGDQHHVFTHGIEQGRDVLRHGWFDPQGRFLAVRDLRSGPEHRPLAVCDGLGQMGSPASRLRIRSF